jgi:hypothetical protein
MMLSESTVSGRMADELEKVRKEVGGLLEVLSRHLPGGSKVKAKVVPVLN